MDKEFKQKLILIGVIFLVVMVFYYIASPYQNCLRAVGKDAEPNYRVCLDSRW